MCLSVCAPCVPVSQMVSLFSDRRTGRPLRAFIPPLLDGVASTAERRRLWLAHGGVLINSYSDGVLVFGCPELRHARADWRGWLPNKVTSVLNTVWISTCVRERKLTPQTGLALTLAVR